MLRDCIRYRSINELTIININSSRVGSRVLENPYTIAAATSLRSENEPTTLLGYIIIWSIACTHLSGVKEGLFCIHRLVY